MRGRGANLMALLTVGEAMRPLPGALPGATPLNEAIDRLTEEAPDGLPVVDEQGLYVGTLGSHQVEEAMRENALDATAGELAQELPPLAPGETLEHALGALLRAGSGLPVVAGGRAPVGWLTHTDVLRAYNARLRRGLADAERPARPIRSVGRLRARLRGYRIVDLELANADGTNGARLGSLGWPEGTSVLAIRRGGRVFEPRSEDCLEAGDRLTVLVPSGAADDLVDVLSAPRAERESGRLSDLPPRGGDRARPGRSPASRDRHASQ
jgi:CBS domain-containing protein